jgi:hypothetical protein
VESREVQRKGKQRGPKKKAEHQTKHTKKTSRNSERCSTYEKERFSLLFVCVLHKPNVN